MPDAFSEYIDKYLNYLQVERHASPYTVRNYKGDLRDLFSFLEAKGIDSLHKVDKHVLRDYMSYLSQRGIIKASIARKLSAVRSLYRYLVREGIVPESPLPLSRKMGGRLSSFSIKLERRLPSYLTVEETIRLFKAPDLATPQGRRDRAIIELLYASGLRVSELVNLNLEHISLHSRQIRAWGKGSKERIALMGEPAASALDSYLDKGRPELLAEKKSSAVFVNRYGKRLTQRSVQILLKEHARSAGIQKNVYPHLLRHTFATHLLDGGADLRVVQELLGHSQLSSTQIYTHVTRAQAKRVYLSAHPMAKDEDDNDRK